MMFRLSKRFVLLNVLLAAVAVFLGVLLVRDYMRKIPLPAPPAARRAQPASPEEPAAPTVADEKLTTYNVIVAKHLFNPSRSEGGPPPPAPAPRPPLHLRNRHSLASSSTDRRVGPTWRTPSRSGCSAIKSATRSREDVSTRSPTTRS